METGSVIGGNLYIFTNLNSKLDEFIFSAGTNRFRKN
jgi:hypothetical protein